MPGSSSNRNYTDTDSGMSANSDLLVPSQKAVKTALATKESLPTTNSTTTTDATPTTISTISISSSKTTMIEAKVVARRTGGTSGTAEDGAGYVIYAAYKNVAGTATEIGETSIFSTEDQPSWACTLIPSGSNAIVQVTGAIDNNVQWNIFYRTYLTS